MQARLRLVTPETIQRQAASDRRHERLHWWFGRLSEIVYIWSALLLLALTLWLEFGGK